MKMTKQGSALLKEWPDLLLFCNYKTIVVENDGKKKAKGARRVMYSAHHACWDAKNRFNLPEMMDLGIDHIKGLFNVPSSTQNATAQTAATSSAASASAPEKTPPPQKEASSTQAETVPESDELRQLNTLMEMAGISPEQLQVEVAKKGICPPDMPYTKYHTDLLKRIISGWEIIAKTINK
jgi:hypothetical protein